MKKKNPTRAILTITGSDGTGGSGVQADIRFISRLGGVAASAITSITVQNTLGIQEFYDLSASIVRQQVEAIINDLQPQVVKLGLLRRIDVVEAVAEVLSHYRPRHVIYAPVKESAHGERLLSPQVYEAIERLILPLCTVVLEARQEGPHGTANQLSSVVAVLLNRGEQPDEAIRHAHELLADLPVGYVESMGRSGELYNQFLDAVERFYYRYADVAFYAEQLNVSSPYLGQVTRRIAGRSPKTIIDERITAEIVSLLTTTTYPLKEIAHRLGFSSQAHLSRFFKKQKGISPLQYRQK
ncbi:MAG: bifunctional hydroxymethylpyrimidine kinase/phosphomethylpyrimidine kinase [Bacteroidales bacterium]|nr:bifunctional hydroxymethylpyrimidine kinase/phosphomethylpyrimidine kinase [Bacteroidales bacterium]